MKDATLIGSSGEFSFIAQAIRRDFIVSTPSLNHYKYDIILDTNHGRFLRVQVKTTGSDAKDGVFKLNLNKRAGTKNTYNKDNSDFLVYYIETLNIFYMIPIKVIRDRSKLSFYPFRSTCKFHVFKNAWWLLF